MTIEQQWVMVPADGDGPARLITQAILIDHDDGGLTTGSVAEVLSAEVEPGQQMMVVLGDEVDVEVADQ